MARPQATMPCYRFGEFVLSPRRRALYRHGEAQALIPRYFDLLLFLVERRGDAVHRRDIFDTVWRDVVVSDSALSQAVRTIRRVLDDDSREPRFVRTVSRHGYQFVFADVIEEDDMADRTVFVAAAEARAATAAVVDPYAPLLERLLRPAATAAADEEQREAAERLHALGTAEALRRLGTAPETAFARALLRDTRWDTPEAGPVPIVGAPSPWRVSVHLVRLRLRRAAGIVAARWATASAGSGSAGALAGAAGGLLLAAVPESSARLSVVPVLALVGAVCGALGGAGVGAGLAVAESVMRSRRVAALIVGGALGGGLIGGLAQVLARWGLEALAGLALPVGGGLEGIVIGAGAALGYALSTGAGGVGLAAPRGRARWTTALAVAGCCAAAALGLALGGRPLVGGTLHRLAQASAGAQVSLAPLGRLLGEPGFGPVSAAIIALWEGGAFGFGLAIGLTRRR